MLVWIDDCMRVVRNWADVFGIVWVVLVGDS